MIRISATESVQVCSKAHSGNDQQPKAYITSPLWGESIHFIQMIYWIICKIDKFDNHIGQMIYQVTVNEV